MREMVFTDIEIKVGDEVIFNHHYHGGLDWEEEDVYTLDFFNSYYGGPGFTPRENKDPEELIKSEVVSVPSPYRDNSVKHIITCLSVQSAAQLAVDIMVYFQERINQAKLSHRGQGYEAPKEDDYIGFMDEFGNEVDTDKVKEQVWAWVSGGIYKA